MVWRLGTYIPIPGINPDIVEQVFQQHNRGIFFIFDVFVGGALGRMAIFALGLIPYIAVSVLVRSAIRASRPAKNLDDEGHGRHARCDRYTRYAAALLAASQAYGISVFLKGVIAGRGAFAVIDPGLVFRLTTVATLTGGAIFLAWLAGQISERGVGNGIWLIIIAGVVAELPKALFNTLAL